MRFDGRELSDLRRRTASCNSRGRRSRNERCCDHDECGPGPVLPHWRLIVLRCATSAKSVYIRGPVAKRVLERGHDGSRAGDELEDLKRMLRARATAISVRERELFAQLAESSRFDPRGHFKREAS